MGRQSMGLGDNVRAAGRGRVMCEEMCRDCGHPAREADARARCREAAQILIEVIGAEGPESVVETASRAAEAIRDLIREIAEIGSRLRREREEALVKLDRLQRDVLAFARGIEQAEMPDLAQALRGTVILRTIDDNTDSP
jgi:hypothetical protein